MSDLADNSHPPPAKHAFQAALASVTNPASDTVIAQYVDELFRRVSLPSDDAQMGRTLDEMLSHLEAGRANAYVNLACEIGVANHFKEKHAGGFEYQVTKPVPPDYKGIPTSFDFAFRSSEASFNIEVKNFSRPWKPRGAQKTLKSFLPPAQSTLIYRAGIPLDGTTSKPLRAHLDKANGQLWRKDAINVTLVCANDLDEYADATEVLWGPHGLMQDAEAVARLPNIDAVVVSNYGFLHHCMLDAARIEDFYQSDELMLSHGATPWRFEGSFSFGLRRIGNIPGEALFAELGREFNLINPALEPFRAQYPDELQEALFALFKTIPLQPARD